MKIQFTKSQMHMAMLDLQVLLPGPPRLCWPIEKLHVDNRYPLSKQKGG